MNIQLHQGNFLPHGSYVLNANFKHTKKFHPQSSTTSFDNQIPTTCYFMAPVTCTTKWMHIDTQRNVHSPFQSPTQTKGPMSISFPTSSPYQRKEKHVKVLVQLNSVWYLLTISNFKPHTLNLSPIEDFKQQT
jgi:hypothetical protein